MKLCSQLYTMAKKLRLLDKDTSLDLGTNRFMLRVMIVDASSERPQNKQKQEYTHTHTHTHTNVLGINYI